MATESNAELIEQMRHELRTIQDQQAANEEALNRLDDDAATVTSTDGAVTVAASAEGLVTSVTVTDAALHRGAAELSRLLTTTARQAAAAARGEQADADPETTAPQETPTDRSADHVDPDDEEPFGSILR